MFMHLHSQEWTLGYEPLAQGRASEHAAVGRCSWLPLKKVSPLKKVKPPGQLLPKAGQGWEGLGKAASLEWEQNMRLGKSCWMLTWDKGAQ